MKLSFVCALSLLLGACSSAVTPPAALPTSQTEVVAAIPAPTPVTPKDHVIDRSTFTITVPSSFIPEPGYPKLNEEVTNEFLFKSPSNVGDYPIVVAMNSIRLSDEDPADEDFGGAIAMFTIENEDNDVTVAKPVNVSGHVGSIVVYVTDDTIGMIQQAVAYNRTGYLIRCGGDSEREKDVVAVCKKVLASFKIKE